MYIERIRLIIALPPISVTMLSVFIYLDVQIHKFIFLLPPCIVISIWNQTAPIGEETSIMHTGGVLPKDDM